MALASYDYNKSVDPDRLTAEIRSSTDILTAVDHIDTLGAQVTIWFKSQLSNSEQTALDVLVEAHVNEKLPSMNVQAVVINSMPAFAAKQLADGKKIFKRVVGAIYPAVSGRNRFVWVATFDWVKFMGVEVIGGELGDTASLIVLDSESGRISGYPNVPLNQFGFSVNVAKDFYAHKSEFDADLYKGLQIQIDYESVSDKKIGVNFIMNEVK